MEECECHHYAEENLTVTPQWAFKAPWSEGFVDVSAATKLKDAKTFLRILGRDGLHFTNRVTQRTIWWSVPFSHTYNMVVCTLHTPIIHTPFIHVTTRLSSPSLDTVSSCLTTNVRPCTPAACTALGSAFSTLAEVLKEGANDSRNGVFE